MAARKRKGAATSSQAKAPRKRAPRAGGGAKRKRTKQERPPAPSSSSKRPVKPRKAPAAPRAPRSRKKVAPAKPRKKVAPRKPSKAAAAKAAKAERARARREELRFLREAEAALLAERKRRRNELARNRRRRKRAEAGGDELGYMRTILADMAERSPIVLHVSFTEAEPGARVPWLIVGRFEIGEEIGYAELFQVFASWRDDLLLEARIHPQRMSQIRIVYNDPKSKRGEGDSIVSHEGPWEAVISESSSEIDPDDDDSLASRYEATTVPHFYVYFSSEIVSELSDHSLFTR